MDEVAERLARRGRELDPSFESTERLFRRIHPAQFAHGDPLASGIKFPVFSVNREKYSQVEDVILGHPEYGIFAFEVRAIPAPFETPDGPVFGFSVTHVPEELNYAHSEVRTMANGVEIDWEPPKTVRTRFRMELRADPSFEILKKPGGEIR